MQLSFDIFLNLFLFTSLAFIVICDTFVKLWREQKIAQKIATENDTKYINTAQKLVQKCYRQKKGTKTIQC